MTDRQTAADGHELKTGGDRGYLRIATEEAFATEEQLDYLLAMIADGTAEKGVKSLYGFYGKSPSDRATAVRNRLIDIGAQRIADMDATGIDKAVLALTAPGVQTFLDLDDARRMAGNANRKLADACEKYPDRFIGLGTVATQDPAWAAQEIHRCASEYGFKGIQINGHTRGRYLDDEFYDPIFRALVEVDQPLYIHPSPMPDSLIDPFVEVGLDAAIYGFGVDTGLHLLRLLVSGIFDRYPSLQIMVGHMGEAIPYWLYRIEYMHNLSVKANRYERMKPLKKSISEYLRSNILVTNSGVAWEPAVKFCQQVMGEDRVLYAMDYPYQFEASEVRAMDNMDMPAATKKKFFQTNAERWFRL